MIHAVQISQQWPVNTDRTKISPTVVRSHLLANPQGMTISDIADRAGITKYAGDNRACVSAYLAAVWRILTDLEDIGAAVEVNERWYDALALERANRERQRRAKYALDFVA